MITLHFYRTNHYYLNACRCIVHPISLTNTQKKWLIWYARDNPFQLRGGDIFENSKSTQNNLYIFLSPYWIGTPYISIPKLEVCHFIEMSLGIIWSIMPLSGYPNIGYMRFKGPWTFVLHSTMGTLGTIHNVTSGINLHISYYDTGLLSKPPSQN